MADKYEQYAKVAVGDIGTQLFWFNNKHTKTDVTENTFASLKSSLYTKDAKTGVYSPVGTSDTFTEDTEYYTIPNKFEYGLPVTAGAEFGGDTESFEAPETDSDVVAKLVGRTSPNDVQYVANYTAVKYERILSISDNININTYMEVLSDGSAMIFDGTSGTPTITAGDVRQINWTIAPNAMAFVSNIYDLTENDINRLSKLVNTVFTKSGTGKSYVNIDTESIPLARQQYYTSNNATTA